MVDSNNYFIIAKLQSYAATIEFESNNNIIII